MRMPSLPVVVFFGCLVVAGLQTPAAQSVGSLPTWAQPIEADDPPGFPNAPGSESGPPGFPDAPGSGGGPPAFPDEPASVPIDGGLGFLALAGGAYAARRLRRRSEGARSSAE